MTKFCITNQIGPKYSNVTSYCSYSYFSFIFEIYYKVLPVLASFSPKYVYAIFSFLLDLCKFSIKEYSRNIFCMNIEISAAI